MSKPRAAKTNEEQHETEAMMKLMMEDLLTAQEAAELLGTNDSRVRQLIRAKRIPAVKKGREWIIHRPSLAKYLKSKSRRGRPPSGQKTGT